MKKIAKLQSSLLALLAVAIIAPFLFSDSPKEVQTIDGAQRNRLETIYNAAGTNATSTTENDKDYWNTPLENSNAVSSGTLTVSNTVRMVGNAGTFTNIFGGTGTNYFRLQSATNAVDGQPDVFQIFDGIYIIGAVGYRANDLNGLQIKSYDTSTNDSFIIQLGRNLDMKMQTAGAAGAVFEMSDTAGTRFGGVGNGSRFLALGPTTVSNNFTVTSNITLFSNSSVTGGTNLLFAPRAMLRAQGHAAFGSTDTSIRRLANTITNTGEGVAWTYVTNAANGSTITIYQDGLYSLQTTHQGALSAISVAGFSQNSTQLTTTLLSINTTNRLCFGAALSGASDSIDVHAAGTFWLNSNDVIRPHANNSVPGVAARSQFSIIQVSR